MGAINVWPVLLAEPLKSKMLYFPKPTYLGNYKLSKPKEKGHLLSNQYPPRFCTKENCRYMSWALIRMGLNEVKGMIRLQNVKAPDKGCD